MNAVAASLVELGFFVYRFVVGDDWVVALVMLLALMVTAALVAMGIDAWWLVPLLAVVMTGISLRRHGRPA